MNKVLLLCFSLDCRLSSDVFIQTHISLDMEHSWLNCAFISCELVIQPATLLMLPLMHQLSDATDTAEQDYITKRIIIIIETDFKAIFLASVNNSASLELVIHCSAGPGCLQGFVEVRGER